MDNREKKDRPGLTDSRTQPDTQPGAGLSKPSGADSGTDPGPRREPSQVPDSEDSLSGSPIRMPRPKGRRGKGLLQRMGFFDLVTPDFLLSAGSIVEVAGTAMTVLGEIGSRRNGGAQRLKQLEETEKKLSEVQEQLRKIRAELERYGR